ncbi:MAG: DUF885 domain-containing protein [Bacteroidota bacterium]
MRYSYLLLSLIVLAACTPSDNGSKALQSVLDSSWEYRIAQNPMFATSLGMKEYNHLLPEVSEEKIQEDGAFWEKQLAALEEIDASRLSETDKVNYEMFQYLLKDRIAGVKYQAYLVPVNAEGGFYTGFAFVPRNMPFETEEDYENYLSRLSAFSEYADQYMTLMKTGMERGMVPPRNILKSHPGMIDTYIQAKPEESPFFAPFLKIPDGISPEKQQELQLKGVEAISTELQPTYQKIKTFMEEEYIPAARETFGAIEYPNGKDYYEQRVQYFTTLPYSSEEVFAIGEQEVARIMGEMTEIIDSLGFEGSYADFLQFLRTDDQFYVKNARRLLEKASYIAKKIDGTLPKYFGKLPRNSYGVQPVPDAIAPNYTAGRYVSGSLDNHRSGTYWVNTYNLPSRTLYTLPALTLHEAVPGHHFQHAIAEELKEMPEFRSRTYINSYGEGWALYTEKLGKEMGIYETLYEDFGRLTYEMWRACRLVVDVGLHTKGWTRDQAVEYMGSRTALSIHEINTEIDRYIGWPGQALSYKMGELTIVRLREKAEAELGEDFNLREFHDLLLSQGAIPMFILDRMVDEYIKEKQVS